MTEENLTPQQELPTEETPSPVEEQSVVETQTPQEPDREGDLKPSKALSVYAVVSLIAGLGAYVWFFAMIKSQTLLAIILAPIISLLAIITGHKAKSQIRHYIGVMTGKKLANYGLFLGYFLILFGVFIVVLVLTGVISAITAIFGL
jgi:hypothetical protein